MRWLPHLLMLFAALGAPAFAGDDLFSIGVMAVLVILVGVPHGAVDHITYQHASGQRSLTSLMRFFGGYLVGLSVFTLVMSTLPFLATLVFLLLSVWHFGHSHLEPGYHTGRDKLRAFALGILLLSALMLPHADDSIRVMENWLSTDDASSILNGQPTLAILAGLVWATTGLLDVARRRSALREGLLLLSVLVVSWNANLAWAFVAYFCLGHSIDAWRTEFLFQQGITDRFLRYYRESIPMTAAALLFIGLLALGVQHAWWDRSLVLIATVCGTIPHMLFLDHWVPMRSAAAERSESRSALWRSA